MGKLVVLELEGDLEHQGFRVKLEVGEEGQRPTVKLSGALPCEPDLGQSAISHWLDYYRPLGAPSARQIRPR